MTELADDVAAGGLFGPNAAIRRVHREGVLLLGGGRALLMQVAHPSVAQGVAEHSAYKVDRAGRLLRTLKSTLALVYGDATESRRSAAAINGLHQGVHGAGYDALDPDLLLWVLATLIDTALEMHRRFVGELPETDAEAYYRDMRRVGALLGLPQSYGPADLREFDSYLSRTLAAMQVSDTGRQIARDLFGGAGPLVPWLGLMRQLTSGLLPPQLRSQYGLSWGPRRESVLRALSAASRAGLPLLPAPLRRTPALLMPSTPCTRRGAG